MKEFDKIIGVIPDMAIMEHYGKEFCVMCGRPTANDKTVIELRNLLKSSLQSQRTEMMSRLPEEKVLYDNYASTNDRDGERFDPEDIGWNAALTAVKESLSANQ